MRKQEKAKKKKTVLPLFNKLCLGAFKDVVFTATIQSFQNSLTIPTGTYAVCNILEPVIPM